MNTIPKNNFAEVLKISNKYTIKGWRYHENIAINMVDKMETKTGFIATNENENRKMNYDLIITLPVESTIHTTRFGDEIIGSEVAKVHLVVFQDGKSLGQSIVYKFHSVENYEKEIQKIWKMLKYPVYCNGEKYKGYGFQISDEHIFLFNKLEKYESFKAGTTINILHFDKIIDLKFDFI